LQNLTDSVTFSRQQRLFLTQTILCQPLLKTMPTFCRR
jgi:hypothetical protein